MEAIMVRMVRKERRYKVSGANIDQRDDGE